MIRSFLHRLDRANQRTGRSRRTLLHGLPRSTIQRWRARQRSGAALLQKPGPKKTLAPDWPALLASIRILAHGRKRTAGTTALQHQHRDAISRRALQQLVQEERDQQHARMQRIHWLLTGTAWSIDATGFHDRTLVPLYDLASRYQFAPLLNPCEDGHTIAAFLDAAFRRTDPPLLLKRDNGSPFNCHEVDAVLARHKVLPLNSPPRYPPYNGGMEKCIGDLKRRLARKLAEPPETALLTATVEAMIHEMNHQPRRSLRGQTPCEIFHAPDRRLSLSGRDRDQILRLLLADFCSNLQSTAAADHRAFATVWRRTVESWLRCQGLITISQNRKTNTPVSTIFPKKWSHN